jgi:hypothetical protein
MPPDPDPTEERRTGPTPAGGVGSVVYYQDAAGRPCPRSRAVAGEAHELDAAGRSIMRTYFECAPAPSVDVSV